MCLSAVCLSAVCFNAACFNAVCFRVSTQYVSQVTFGSPNLGDDDNPNNYFEMVLVHTNRATH